MTTNQDLHGNAPDNSSVALLLIDVINDMEFDGGELLLEHALPVSEALADLVARCRTADVPVVYVNDNFGRWRSDFRSLVSHCRQPTVRGRMVAERLQPRDDDYFVLKPKHSGFYATSLDILLRYLQVRTLILGGFAGNLCVQFTANEAYMRDYRLYVPCDCSASNTVEANELALALMQSQLKADIRAGRSIDLAGLKRL